MMAVEVETPEDYAGNVMGDLSSRRGMVQGMDDMVGGGKAIKAEVPLSEMFGYSTTLRSVAKAVPPTPWNSSTTRKLRATWPKPSLHRAPSNHPLEVTRGINCLGEFFKNLRAALRSCAAARGRNQQWKTLNQ
jgi:hypothetical protein